MPMRRRIEGRSRRDRLATSRPRTEIVPRVGFRARNSMRNRLLLPAPEGPVRNWKDCLRISKVRSLRISRPASYLRPTLSNLITDPSLLPPCRLPSLSRAPAPRQSASTRCAETTTGAPPGVAAGASRRQAFSIGALNHGTLSFFCLAWRWVWATCEDGWRRMTVSSRSSALRPGADTGISCEGDEGARRVTARRDPSLAKAARCINGLKV